MKLRAPSKFSCGCGWPSFDDAIAGHVEEEVNPDGVRMEMHCARCKGHLGHVFRGEGLTPKNERHCVNSISLRFVPAFNDEGDERTIFAAGCFWGIQKFFDGIVSSTTAGYIGGWVVDPRYEEVCTGETGHTEAVEVICCEATFAQLLEQFHEIYDLTPTKSQYQSAVFCLSQTQAVMASQFYFSPASLFYPAEDYHQHR